MLGAILNPGGAYTGPIILDLRVHRVSRLETGFIRAVIEFANDDEEGGTGEAED